MYIFIEELMIIIFKNFIGKLVSMRHLKEEVSSIKTNDECGLRFENPMLSFQPGDIIICINVKKQKKKIEWDPGF